MTNNDFSKLLDKKLQPINNRLLHLEKNMATKDDLKRTATRDDLKKSASKDDLKNFATKDDLKGLASKDDLKNFATKNDLKGLASKDDLKGMATKNDLAKSEKKLGKQINKVDKKLTEFFDFLDETVMQDRRRLDRIESHLDMPPMV